MGLGPLYHPSQNGCLQALPGRRRQSAACLISQPIRSPILRASEAGTGLACCTSVSRSASLPISVRAASLQSTPPSATHARERTRRLRTLAAAGAALLTVLLLLAVESWQHSALQSRANISTGRDVLGLPADAAVVEAASNGERATGWWGLWQVGSGRAQLELQGVGINN